MPFTGDVSEATGLWNRAICALLAVLPKNVLPGKLATSLTAAKQGIDCAWPQTGAGFLYAQKTLGRSSAILGRSDGHYLRQREMESRDEKQRFLIFRSSKAGEFESFVTKQVAGH